MTIPYFLKKTDPNASGEGGGGQFLFCFVFSLQEVNSFSSHK